MMNSKTQLSRAIFSGLILWTFLINSLPVRAQSGDIVSSDDISAGSSVFVFRQSRKAPQAKFASRAKVKQSATAKAATRKNVQSQVATVSPKRQKFTKVDPNAVATNNGKNTGKNTGKNGNTTIPVKTATKEETSNSFAGAAEGYLEKDQLDEAITWFKKAIDLNKANQNAKLGLSEALTRKGNAVFEKTGARASIPFYEEAITNDPNNAGAYAALGSAYDDLTDPESSFQNFDKALKLNSNLTELYAPLGVAYYQRADYEKADELLTKAVALRAEDDQTQLLLGLIRYKQGRYPESLDALNRSMKIKDTPEAHYYLGEIYDKMDRDKDAIAEYNKAVAADPKFTEAWFDLGAANYNRGRFNEAINAYNQAALLRNNDPEIRENLADVYRQLNQYDKAASEYQLATTLIEANKPKDRDNQSIADLYGKFGFVLGRLEKWGSSATALNRAVALSPDNIDFTNLGWAFYNGAQKDFVAKDKAAANVKLAQGKEALQKAASMNSQNAATYMNLGLVQNDLGEHQDATESFKKSITLRNNWIPAYNELGYAYRLLNDYDNAIKNFKIAYDLYDKKPFDPNAKEYYPALFNWAESEFRRGNLKEAKRLQDKLRKINPNLANQLELVFNGAVLTNPKAAVENKLNEKNPLKKIPKLPF